MSIAPITPGWLIGYLVSEDDDTCHYRLLPVVSLAQGTDNSIEPIVATPDGKMVRADALPGRAFSVGPGEDANKIAAAHAASRGRLGAAHRTVS